MVPKGVDEVHVARQVMYEAVKVPRVVAPAADASQAEGQQRVDIDASVCQALMKRVRAAVAGADVVDGSEALGL